MTRRQHDVVEKLAEILRKGAEELGIDTKWAFDVDTEDGQSFIGVQVEVEGGGYEDWILPVEMA
jgi:hypothetical protein